jgi:large subunit ribosomal protein L18
MAISKSILKYRRRREGRTDYKRRLALLKSGQPRLVVRTTNNDTLVQVVQYSAEEGDIILASCNHKKLKEQGWSAPGGNIPSAYLAGLLCGKLAGSKIKNAILDSGKGKLSKGNLVFAALKGFSDSGIEIPFSEDKLPSEDRVAGKHIESYAALLQKDSPERYKSYFGKYLKDQSKPEELSKLFAEVKSKIMS